MFCSITGVIMFSVLSFLIAFLICFVQIEMTKRKIKRPIDNIYIQMLNKTKECVQQNTAHRIPLSVMEYMSNTISQHTLFACKQFFLYSPLLLPRSLSTCNLWCHWLESLSDPMNQYVNWSYTPCRDTLAGQAIGE